MMTHPNAGGPADNPGKIDEVFSGVGVLVSHVPKQTPIVVTSLQYTFTTSTARRKQPELAGSFSWHSSTRGRRNKPTGRG